MPRLPSAARSYSPACSRTRARPSAAAVHAELHVPALRKRRSERRVGGADGPVARVDDPEGAAAAGVVRDAVAVEKLLGEVQLRSGQVGPGVVQPRQADERLALEQAGVQRRSGRVEPRPRSGVAAALAALTARRVSDPSSALRARAGLATDRVA